MTRTPNRSRCPQHEEACQAAAWALGDDPGFAAHRQQCDACREALVQAEAFARRVGGTGSVPPDIVKGLASEIFSRTTRGAEVATRRTRAWTWAGLGAGLAASAAAFLALRRPPAPLPGEDLELAEVDPDLLENLDLAEELEVLEVLDALEALDHV